MNLLTLFIRHGKKPHFNIKDGLEVVENGAGNFRVRVGGKLDRNDAFNTRLIVHSRLAGNNGEQLDTISRDRRDEITGEPMPTDVPGLREARLISLADKGSTFFGESSQWPPPRGSETAWPASYPSEAYVLICADEELTKLDLGEHSEIVAKGYHSWTDGEGAERTNAIYLVAIPATVDESNQQVVKLNCRASRGDCYAEALISFKNEISVTYDYFQDES